MKQSLAILCPFLGLLLLLHGQSPGIAGDNWPMWRHDANRSAATDAAGPSQPNLRWQLSLEYPDPAFDHQYRMCADATYAPVAAEGLVFIPSNVSDQLMACELETGAIRWRYFTEGPVRFAPVYRAGKVWLVSDDGYLHCVSAKEGKLLWKIRGAPETLPDSRMLVNGRLCSRWPARGAPVEHDGVIYFGAGIWPEEGVYVCAVNAETGRLLWRSDAMSYVKDGMSDHGRAYDLSLPPQGYLAMIDGRLAVPSGRSLAAWFDPKSGAMEPYTCFYVKHNPPRGTWYLAGIGQYYVQGGNWFGTRPDAAPPLPPELSKAQSPLVWSREMTDNEQYVLTHRPFLNADTYRLHPENLYIEPVLTATTLYTSEFTDESKYLVPRGHTHVTFPSFDRIVARDLTHPRWTTTAKAAITDRTKKLTMPRLEFPVVWELVSPLRVLIKAGDHLYAGGSNTIAAIAIPQKGEKPRVAWQATVDGTPVNALVAKGHLIITTDNGNIFCFGPGSTRSVASPSAKAPHTSPPQGYACVLGWNDGTRAKKLASDRQHHVVVFEPDAAKAREARNELATAGIHGRQVQVIQATLDSVIVSPYWANLIIGETTECLDWLRPQTGRLLLPRGKTPVVPDGYSVKTDGDTVTIHRNAPPKGADTWTHESGGPANRYANSDQLVKWPLGVLWYSGNIDRYFTPASHFQHERQPYPLVLDGRMFLITGQVLHAIDIYTGGYLWKSEMPLTPWVQTRLFDSRVYGRPTERNYVVASDWIYVVTGENILAYDTATGRNVKTFEVPSQFAGPAAPPPREEKFMGQRATIQATPLWTEVRLWKNLLVTMLGKNLVALDRHSGDVRWSRASSKAMTTYAVGGDTLFGLDHDTSKSGLLFAMNPETGKIVWQKQAEYAAVPRHTVDNPRPWLPPVAPELSYNPKHAFVVLTVNRNGVHLFRAADGSPVWSKPDTAGKNVAGIYPPVVTDDYIVLSQYHGCYGFPLDILTGKELGENTGIPRPRTCARIIGNNNLLVYRDAATELYDIAQNRMIGLNSLRSGCTTSFIPAGGIVTAPMLGHGCVCNYPMFASLALFHNPRIESWRPAAIARSWSNQAPVKTPAPVVANVNVEKFRLINATIAKDAFGFAVASKDQGAGYAVRPADRPLEKAVFTFAVKRRPGSAGQGNAFFVCGSSDNWIECRLYYGGRRNMEITGKLVEPAKANLNPVKAAAINVTVTVDCTAKTVTLEAAGAKLTTKITAPITAITHYGCGGANADNVFTEIAVR
ncbi:MAG: hypothetical protein FJ395_17855 [Verrucomicrobia bacterium]|nr:hypothetical protein [Verrucomicrobiota bacterium]